MSEQKISIYAKKKVIVLEDIYNEYGLNDAMMRMKKMVGWDIQLGLLHCELAAIGLNGEELSPRVERLLREALEKTKLFILGELPVDSFILTREIVKGLFVSSAKVGSRGRYTTRGRLKIRAVRSAVLNLDKDIHYRIDLMSSCVDLLHGAFAGKKESVNHFQNPYWEDGPEERINAEFVKFCRLEGIYAIAPRKSAYPPDFSILKHEREVKKVSVMEEKKLRATKMLAKKELIKFERERIREDALRFILKDRMEAEQEAAKIFKSMQEGQELKKTLDNKNDL